MHKFLERIKSLNEVIEPFVNIWALIDILLKTIPLIIAIIISLYSKYYRLIPDIVVLKVVIFFFLMFYPAAGIVHYLSEYNKTKKLELIGNLLNPYIFIESDVIVCKFNEKRVCVRTDTTAIRSLKDEVKEVIFCWAKTPAKNVKIKIKEGGKLVPPDLSISQTNYVFRFDKELEKGQSHTLVKEIKADLSQAPYLIQTYGSCRGCGSLLFRLVFPIEDIPKIVYAYVSDALSTKQRGNKKEITFKDSKEPGKKEAEWEVDKADLKISNKYTIEWEWRDKKPVDTRR